MLHLSSPVASQVESLSDSSGIIAALAIDQRKSLAQMIARAAAVDPETITPDQLADFKTSVSRVLTPYASAVLLDPEYGLSACAARAPGSGLLMTYEMDGYENPRPHRMLALMPEYSVARLKELGADAVKILLSWTPFDDPTANEQKKVLIERIGAECEAVGLPFLLEPVGYDPAGGDVRGLEYAKQKPEIVIQSMEEFSKDRYRVTVLKVEFPVNPVYVKGGAFASSEFAYTEEEALEIYRRADAVARRPYIYLSAGVSSHLFIESLRLANESLARYSGVLCGRAIWQDGIQAFAKSGTAALEDWLADAGVRNMQSVTAALREAQPWWTWSSNSAS